MRKLLVLFGIILVSVVAVLIVRALHTKQEPVPEPDNTTVFPAGTGTQTTGTGLQIQIAGEKGEGILVHEFISRAREDENNKGYYSLEPDGSNEPFRIVYIAETQYFNITLLREPLGESRKRAETYLKNMLGISENEMCILSYVVTTPNAVNSVYSGTSLGFSFCPGAVTLP
jgi:hypothetical protein